MGEPDVWKRCVSWLEGELSSHDVNTWIRPLQVSRSGQRLLIVAPNRMVMERVRAQFSDALQRAWMVCDGSDLPVEVVAAPEFGNAGSGAAHTALSVDSRGGDSDRWTASNKLDPRYTFDSFIQGRSNLQARAAAQHVSESPGVAYNPLLIYGATGLGKTHLMNAIGNAILRNKPQARVVYVGAEQWVTQFIGALRHNTADEFKNYYRSADALLIDDIHFFAGKASNQEEFFHTFNTLMDGRKQIVLTSDRFPKELDRLDERLKSRFTWGLTVSIEPPDLETRVAILMAKAEVFGFELSQDVAFFVAQHIRSNVRELEGALLSLTAGLRLQGKSITVESARTALRDMLAHYERQVTIDNIMVTVSKYYNIPAKELRSSRRSRSLARPRQIAMCLTRELTQHSLPEIGQAFEKDHTTVLHACRTVNKLRETDTKVHDDYENLLRQLSF
jgi:chromosomal replication initiator protein